jgi:catechol 2,3-dioxygenase
VKLPETNFRLPFSITRASHVELSVSDLDRSVRFYSEVIGLVVTERDADVAYLRGLEEAAHHSLMLRKSPIAECGVLGFRVFLDEHLDRLAERLGEIACLTEFVDRPHQGRTLRLNGPRGMPLEFCAVMPPQPRLITTFTEHRGASAQRLDHFQLLVPDVRGTCEFFTALGFRISEYVTPDDEQIVAAFLQRKGNPHDIVLFRGDGPRFHHVAFTTPDTHTLIRACDVAGELGYGASVERGPGRHGPGHALYVYMRDPDGHRVEIFTTHYQVMDMDTEPVRWDVTDPNFGTLWGLPAQRSWHEDASPFAGVDVETLTTKSPLPTLESYLGVNS